MHCPFSIRVLRSLALIALAALVSCLSHSEQQPELSSDRPPTLRPRSPIAPGCICMLFRAPWDGWGATVATRFFGVGNVKRVRKGGSTWGASRSRRRAISFPSRPPRPPLFSPASLSSLQPPSRLSRLPHFSPPHSCKRTTSSAPTIWM